MKAWCAAPPTAPTRAGEYDALNFLDCKLHVRVLAGTRREHSHVIPCSLVARHYERAEGEPDYPQIVSDLDGEGRPIGWAALSGAVADAEKPGVLYAVSDSAMATEPSIFTIDATAKPARITGKTVVRRGADTGIFFSGARKRGAFSAELTPQDREFLRAVSIKPEA